jgi:hypothetical protein
MSTSNEERCTVIKSEDHEAIAPTADKVGFFRSQACCFLFGTDKSDSVWKKLIDGTVFSTNFESHGLFVLVDMLKNIQTLIAPSVQIHSFRSL